MSEELLPCPFCGSSKVYNIKEGIAWSVVCDCDAEGPWAHDEQLAAIAWNRRPPQSPEQAGWRDIASAPRDRKIEVFAPGTSDRWEGDLGDLVTLCCWHEDAGFCICELREATHWREHVPPLPPPPKPAGEEEGGA